MKFRKNEMRTLDKIYEKTFDIMTMGVIVDFQEPYIGGFDGNTWMSFFSI